MVGPQSENRIGWIALLVYLGVCVLMYLAR